MYDIKYINFIITLFVAVENVRYFRRNQSDKLVGSYVRTINDFSYPLQPFPRFGARRMNRIQGIDFAVNFNLIRTTPLDITQFFLEVVQQAFHHRLSTGYVRKDFVQLLLELREKGEVVSDETRNGDAQRDLSNEFPGNKKEAFEIDDDLLAAQLFVFFIAGFETTASTLNNLMYLLSLNEHCQEKARTEVLRVMGKNNGTLTYDSLKELTYLDHCVSETLRMMPPVPMNFRVCTKDYQFPDGTKIEKGTPVVMPTYSTHYDPQYYPKPKVFMPERFENPPPKGTYLPFGDGPRICIGKRFAEVSMKLSFGKLLAKYRFKPTSQKSDVSDWVPGSLFLLPKQPLKVIIEKIA